MKDFFAVRDLIARYAFNCIRANNTAPADAPTADQINALRAHNDPELQRALHILDRMDAIEVTPQDALRTLKRGGHL